MMEWDLGTHQLEHFLGGPAVGGAGVGVGLDLFLETGHPDLEEFVHVAGDDAQEAQPLQQRGPFIQGLGEHPPVEGEEAEFAIEVILGGEAIEGNGTVHYVSIFFHESYKYKGRLESF